MGLAHAGLIVINSCHLHAFLYVIQRQRLQKPIVVYNIYICVPALNHAKPFQQIIFMVTCL